MSLSQPRTLFGIHQMTPYSRVTGDPYGTARVLAGASINITGELVQLTGGSSPFIWAAQAGNSTAEMSFKPKEIPDFLFQILLGKAPTKVLDDPGNVTTLTNIVGTLVEATTGIASVGVKSGSETDLKFSKFVVKAVSGTTVDVYAYTNVDFFRGTDKTYEDDLLKITASPLTVPDAGAAVEVPGFGVELIGGSGTVLMTADDTASFESNPPSDEQLDVVIGEQGVCVPEFGAMVVAQKQSDGSMFLFDCPRVQAPTGMAFGMEEKAFSESEITASLIYDSGINGILKVRWTKAATGCN